MLQQVQWHLMKTKKKCFKESKSDCLTEELGCEILIGINRTNEYVDAKRGVS